MHTTDINWENYPHLHKYSAPLKPMTRRLVGRDSLIRSIMAAFSRAELCNVILLAPAGCGKALDDNEMIAVNDERGYVRMGDLQVGDEVFDEQGNPTKILGVYPQGDKQAYRVTFNNGTSIVCNDEHIWTVRGKDAHKCGRGYRDMTLHEMLDKGIRKRVVKRNGRVSYHTMWYVPRSHAVNRANAELPVDPYVLGVLIGDGALVSQKGDALVVSSDDTYVVDKVAGALSTIAERNPANYNWYFRPMDGSDRYVRTKDVLSDDMFADTVRGLKSIARSIPEPYFRGNIDQRLALLHGLMDTDGCVTNGYRANVSFSTNSPALARDVQRLAASLGFVTSVTHNDRHDDMHVNREYEIHFRVANEDKHQLFTLPRHLEKLDDCLSRRHDIKFQHKFDDLGIASVVDLGCQIPMTCIYVEAESHLFQAGYDHIVTHNTALVQGTMERDADRLYLEVDLARMIADCQNDTNEMAAKLKMLFSETEKCVRDEEQEIVLFIDEFHQVVQLSAAAVEALKPLLADSGTRGIRVIAATTLEEFNQFIAPNQPLVERLQRINVPEPDEDATVEILKNMAKTYGVDNLFFDDHVFHMIYEYTNRYIPANSQPRKSIKVLDAMVGWNRSENRKMDDRLLADVIQESEDVNVAFRVDASTIKKRLDERVLAQQYATSQIERRLQLCVADLNDKSKPMSTFLFTGSTGVGKGHPIGTLIPTLEDNSTLGYTKVEDIEPGDHVFAPDGSPVEVLGVFPRGKMEVYRVSFSDGRSVVVDRDHLWGVYLYKHDRHDDNLMVIATHRIANMLSEATSRKTRKLRFSVPMNQPVQWPERNLPADPYVLGAFIADGCLTKSVVPLVISGDDEPIVKKCAERIGAAGYERCSNTHNRANGSVSVNYNWKFLTGENYRGKKKLVQKVDVLGMIPEVYDKRSTERRIPELYLRASVEQRWELVRGLFDTDGSIGAKDGGRFNVSYSTSCEGLANDVRELLLSLGVMSTVTKHYRDNGTGSKSIEYSVHVRTAHDDKERFFSLPRKREIARRAAVEASEKTYDTDFVDIVSVEPLPDRVETVCLYVDHPDHLYQCDDFIVTHNTEMTKQLAEILFQDQRRLLRFDMTEYANDDSLERFRDLLTTRIWEHPYSIVLLDEIEKACSSVTRLLLQVLDDGRLTNRNNREVSFTNCYIVLTTNAGSEIYKTIAQYGESNSEKDMAIIAKKYDKLIRRSLSETSGDNRFPPELIGRIDVMVPFQPLSRETMGNIVMMKLRKLKAQVKARHGVQLVIDKDVVRYLVEDNLSTDSDSGGARIVMSKLETEVTTNVARYINEHPFASRIAVKVDGDMAIDNKRQLESKASIKVLAC